MTNETVNEWLKENGLSDTDIDFIETILTFTSTAKMLPPKTDEINNKFQTLFPGRKAKITPYLTYQQFEKVLQDNNLSIDSHDLLNRFRSQGMCAELCEELLNNNIIKFFIYSPEV
ncbi:hypothetical protein J6TS2_08270 [Heyndrickxia sporothermodurans]|nr:hypothetical protein J6TS2_08270 [Heyndrickxia sporothermodurans]